ncbi:unnamed protein product [Mucor fragilis]
MSSDKKELDNESLTGLLEAVSLMSSRSNTSQHPNTITHAPAFDQFNDKLFKSIQQCIESALEPLAQRMADIEKAMVVRTASIAEQVSTVSLNQQVLHQSLLDIMEKVNQLQFEEQSVYRDEESLSSFDIPAKRSAENADNVSVCSTEASEYQSNSEEEEDDGSVCTETAETLNQFLIPEAASVNAERYNQFTRIESRKYTAKFNTASQSTPSSSLFTDQNNTASASSNGGPLEQTERAVTEPPKIIPVVPQTNTAASAISTGSLLSANTTISPITPINQPKTSLTSAAPTLLKKEPVLTTTPATKKTQPITIAPITVSVPTPTSAAEPPSCTTTTEASSEPAPSPSDPARIPSPVIAPLVETQGNRLSPNQKRNRREPIDKKFTYVYFECAISRSRTKCNDARAELAAIGIQSKKLLDVYFPGKRMAAVLFPDSYLDEAIDMLEKNDFIILTDFNPLDSKNLGDPKYKSLSKEERNEIFRDFHEKQMRRAIDRIRYPTKSYVYSDFYKKGWISQETYRYYVADMFRVPADSPLKKRL